jgi:transcriptional regulator with XRE-family HTH domain
MTPVYGLRVWREDGWWLARVMSASSGADESPVNAITQARTLARIEPMARDLIATILDADETEFDVAYDYVLPSDLDELVRDAKGARAWLEAAQDLWQERSIAAARGLTGRGYSLRDVAALLGLSHQRIDQLLAGGSAPDRGRFLIFAASSKVAVQSERERETGQGDNETGQADNVDALLVLRRTVAVQAASQTGSPAASMEARFRELLGRMIEQIAVEAASQSVP